MRVMVLGGSGFIGNAVCQSLADAGHRVISFDVEHPANCDKRISYITGDFFDYRALIESAKRVNCVIHGVSTVNPGNSNVKIEAGYSKDLMQSIRLLEYCAETGKRVIFLSSGGTVYGRATVVPTPEDTPLNPINHYGAVKACIENAMCAFSIQNHAAMLVARISNPYGPGQDYRRGVGFIDAAVRRALAGETIEIWGDGQTIRDYIHISDVARILTALVTYEGDQRVFNIGTGVGSSQIEVLSILQNMGLSPCVKFLPGRTVDIPISILNNSRILPLVQNGFISLESGVKDYVDWLSRHLACSSFVPAQAG